MISGKVNDSQLVTLEGNTNPHAWNKSNDRGAVADDLQLDHVMMLLKRSPEQEAALKLLLDQQQTKGNANYHKWLNEAQFDEAFGVSQRDVAVVVAWLESQGLKVNGVASSGLYIDFSGTAGQVGSAFHTEIHNIQLNTGEKHISNISDPKIPAALAPVVLGPVSLNNFFPHPLNKVKVTQTPSAGGVNPEVKVGPDGSFTGGTCSFITAHKSGASTTCYSVTPGDVATIYNLTPMFTAGYTGKGATIGLIEDSNDYKDSDYATFVAKMFPSSQYGASSANLSTVHPTGPTTCTNPGTISGTDGEVEIDIEYATAAAPAASVVIESCADTRTTFGGLIAVTNLVSGTPPPIMSMSYGECEAENGQAANATYFTAFQQAAAKGVSVFVSSGDESSTSCDANATRATHGIGVSGFASTPYNVAVGGTDFDDTAAGSSATYWNSTNGANSASAKSYIPEIPWNDSCASQVIATYLGYATTYGTSGFCNSSLATSGSAFLTTGSGSGGPSNCYSGTPANTGVSNGTCAGQPKPSWQSVYGNPADSVRDLPDVSLFAANGIWNHYYVVCYSNPGSGLGGAPCTGTLDTWAGFGGTSVSSPIMAGIQTLVNQYVGTTTNGTGALQGNPNYVYYALANQEYGSSGSSTCNSSLGNAAASTCVFYDVTAGDMNVNCRALGGTLHNCYLPSGTNGVGSLTTTSYSPIYNSTSGWDFATGIGTVNATNLATNWANAFPTATALTANPTTVASGGTSVLKATVSAATLDNATSGGTQVPIAGTVTFKDGASAIGSCTLASATCSYTTTPGQLTTGTNNITAVYSGSNAYPGSTSPIVVVTVTAPVQDITFSSVTHNFGGIAVGTSTTGSGNYGVQLTNHSVNRVPLHTEPQQLGVHCKHELRIERSRGQVVRDHLHLLAHGAGHGVDDMERGGERPYLLPEQRRNTVRYRADGHCVALYGGTQLRQGDGGRAIANLRHGADEWDRYRATANPG